MPLTAIQEVKLNVGDLDPTMPFLDDASYNYFLEKNTNSVRRASLDAARAILMLLATRSVDETVDIFSIKGSKAAEQYRLALQMFIKDPNLNPVFTSANIYAGGISNSDIQANNNDSNNNIVVNPFDYSGDNSTVKTSLNNPFEV